jgi:hypothetical protein
MFASMPSSSYTYFVGQFSAFNLNGLRRTLSPDYFSNFGPQNFLCEFFSLIDLRLFYRRLKPRAGSIKRSRFVVLSNLQQF